MITFIHPNRPIFPNPLSVPQSQHNEPLAVSRQLSPELLQLAYQQGIFPWYRDEQFVYWFATQPRFVLQPEQLRIHRSLAKSLRHTPYRVSVNFAFADVIAHCANTPRPAQDGTWIHPEFQAAYTQLHQIGRAHSFEYWQPEQQQWQLKGGLYGVQIGQIFYGESMFAHVSNASKIAFVHAVQFLQQCGVKLIDCQQASQHLARFGAQMMPFADFQAALNQYNPQPLQHNITPKIVFENPA